MKVNLCGFWAISFLAVTANGEPFIKPPTPQQLEAHVESLTDPVAQAAFTGFVMANNPGTVDSLITTKIDRLGGPNGVCRTEIASYCPAAKNTKLVDCLFGKTTGKSCAKELEVVTTLVNAMRTVKTHTNPKATQDTEVKQRVQK